MLVFKTIFQRFLAKYHTNQDTYVGVSYFFRLYFFCRNMDCVFFQKSFDRREVILINNKFNDFWQSEISGVKSKEQLMNLYILARQRIDYTFDFIKRFEEYHQSLDMDTGYNPGKWMPCLIGTEVFD